MNIKKWAVLLLVALLLSGCTSRVEETDSAAEPPAVQDVTPSDSEQIDRPAPPDSTPPQMQTATPQELEEDGKDTLPPLAQSPLKDSGATLTPDNPAKVSPPAAPPTTPPKEVEPLPQTEEKLLLVNSSNPLPADFSIELAYVQDIYRVDASIAEISKQMIADAAAEGVSLLVCSAYRPVESQTRLFNNKVNEYLAMGKSKEEAEKLTAAIIAVPGTSEHHTGLAMDIVTPSYQGLDSGFENTAAFRWLSANAASYGFILRFPADKQEITGIIYEPWHYRYVGVEKAAAIKESGQCLEEYLGKA